MWRDALLAQATLLEEVAAPALLRWTAVAVLGLVVAFVVWAAVAPLSELVRTNGDVGATVPLQRVQHPEALLADRVPDFGRVPDATAAMLAAQTALYAGQRAAEDSQRQALNSQIATARSGIRSLDRLQADARLRLAIVEEEQRMRRGLALSGVYSRRQVIEVDLRHSSAESAQHRHRAGQRRGPGRAGQCGPAALSRLRFRASSAAAGAGGTILPGTVPDPAGRVYHTAFIHLDDTAALAAEGLRLLPGMTAQADVVAGKKTLRDYLFRPMQALRERLFTQR